MYQGDFKVGDRVDAHDPSYGDLHDGKELVVLYMDDSEGYGIGPVGNDPGLHHDWERGWLWYFPDEVRAVVE